MYSVHWQCTPTGPIPHFFSMVGKIILAKTLTPILVQVYQSDKLNLSLNNNPYS